MTAPPELNHPAGLRRMPHIADTVDPEPAAGRTSIRPAGPHRPRELDPAPSGGARGRVVEGWLRRRPARRSPPDRGRTTATSGGPGRTARFEGRGIYGQTLHVDRGRRLVIVLNSAAERPTDRAAGQARQAFIAAARAEVDGVTGQRRPDERLSTPPTCISSGSAHHCTSACPPHTWRVIDRYPRDR